MYLNEWMLFDKCVLASLFCVGVASYAQMPLYLLWIVRLRSSVRCDLGLNSHGAKTVCNVTEVHLCLYLFTQVTFKK